jgi:hypothetical protein
MSVEVQVARDQVGRLIRSKTFENSEVHRRLLQYLAEKAISGEADRLKEYTIGLEAFEKPPTYDPKHDSIVRLQTGRLRQKLAAYYQTEAAGDQVLVSLPKGAFKLNFEPVATPEHDHTPPAWWNPRRKILVLSVVLALVTIWALFSTLSLMRVRRESSLAPDRWSPDLETLWAPVLQSNRPLLVCLGTPLFIRFPAFGFFRDPKTNDWQDIEKSERTTAVRKALGDKDMLPSYAFTGAGDASAAFQISKLLSTRKRDLLLTRSNILSWQQIADNDVVFVGSPKSNPQLQASALAQDIAIEPNGIRNLKPQTGEPVFLEDHLVPGKSDGETHALISMTAGLSGVGALLVIGGNASSDTLAAAEWITQPWHAKELVQRLRTPSGEIPRYYQVVLKVAFKQGIPVQSSYVFHHVLNTAGQRAGAKK